MDCAERFHLLERCAATMASYINASIVWQRLTGALNTVEYRAAFMDREAARIQVDIARYELKRHEETHQCYQDTPVS